MIHGRNIIAIASSRSFDPTSKHHVMDVLSRHNHVLWVNYHGSRTPRPNAADAAAVIHKLRAFLRGPRRLSDTMLSLTPFILPLPRSRVVRQINRRIVVQQIRRALARLPDQPVQLWSFAPDAGYLAGRFGEELDLYYCVDEFSEFRGYDAGTIRSLERQLIGSSDIVITTARHLYDSKRLLHPHTHLVTHGVSYDHFAAAGNEATEVPGAIRELPRPVFGFFGAIQDWVDLDLVAEVARRHPAWSFVLLGKVQTRVDACRPYTNIHLPGQVPFSSLPAYCRGFDVGLIPFKINALTRNVNPIKLREYLAAGLPVVSTDLPEVRPYRPHVLIAGDVEAFDRACRQALQLRTPQHARRRQSAVAHETWDAKVQQLSDLVEARLHAVPEDQAPLIGPDRSGQAGRQVASNL